MDFPKGYSSCGRFYSCKGNFYHLIDEDKNHWKQIESYLPAGTGTHKQPLQFTMFTRLKQFSEGKREIKRALTDSGNLKTEKHHFVNGVLQVLKRRNSILNKQG
ncbi:hypothetical protein OGA32_000094 [Salmonella enterica]|nr:hypothetical protein [Salmonella enterica]